MAWLAGTDGRLLATSVFNGNGLVASDTATECDSAGACHSPRYANKKDVCFSVTETKKKYPAAFKALSREICYLFLVQNTHDVFTFN